MAKRMRDKPNLVTRHPYATVAVVAGAAWLAVREWRKRRNSPAVKKVTAAARKLANGAKKPPPRRRAAASTTSKSATAVH